MTLHLPTLKRRCVGLGQRELHGQSNLVAWVHGDGRYNTDHLGPRGIDGWFKLRLEGVDKNGNTGEGSYFPKIGTQRGFSPSEYTILALLGMCGSGKSMALREFMHRLCRTRRRAVQKLPSTSILLITANITYGDNLNAELMGSADAVTNRDAGFTQADIGYYRSPANAHGDKFWHKPIVLVSLE